MEVVSSNMCKTSEKGGISERSENGENSDLSEKSGGKDSETGYGCPWSKRKLFWELNQTCVKAD